MKVSLRNIIELAVTLSICLAAIASGLGLIPARHFSLVLVGIFVLGYLYYFFISRRSKPISKNLLKTSTPQSSSNFKTVTTLRDPKKLFVVDDRKPLERFWEGLSFAFSITFLILFLVLLLSTLLQQSEITEEQWRAFASLTTACAGIGFTLGLYFGLIKLLKFNLTNRWVGTPLIVLGVLFIPLFGRLMWDLYDLVIQ